MNKKRNITGVVVLNAEETRYSNNMHEQYNSAENLKKIYESGYSIKCEER